MSVQDTASKTNNLTVSVERSEVPALNAETLQNLREIDALFYSNQILKYK